VAHTCNPGYSGGSKFQDNPRQIVFVTLSVKKPITKRAGGVAQGEGPEFKSSTTHTKKRLVRRKLNFWLLYQVS
jgi:hypothetical protein